MEAALGAGVARRLAADGFHVAILSSSGKGEALAKDLGGFGVTGSNQSNKDLKRLADGTVEKWSRIDVLVNSAGHGPRAPILWLSDEDWHQGMEVHFLNVVRPTRLVTPIKQKQKSGVHEKGVVGEMFDHPTIISASTPFSLSMSSPNSHETMQIGPRGTASNRF